MTFTNVILSYRYDDQYQAELQSAPTPQQQPQSMVSYASETSDGYVPAGSISIPRGYRQMQTNGGQTYQSTQSVFQKIGDNESSYTASIRGAQRNVKVIDIPSTFSMPAETMTIQVPPSSQPLTFILKSRSSQLNLQSSHQSEPGSYKETNSEDGLQVLVHSVTRPILHEIREIITPYRRVTQEVKPVQETAETLIAQDKRSGYSNNKNNGQSLSANKPKQQPNVLAQKPLKLAPQSQQQKNYNTQVQQQSSTMTKPVPKQQQQQQSINRPAPMAAQKPKTY